MTYTKNPDYWDTTRTPLPDRNEIKCYEKEEAGDPRHPGRRDRRPLAVLRGQRQGPAERREHQRDRAARRAAPPDAHAHRQGAVQRQARAPGHRAAARPRQHRQGPARGQVRLRQRQPVRARLPVDGQVGRAAQAGHREGQGAAVGGRQEQPLRSRSAAWSGFEMPQYAAARSRTTSRPAGIDVEAQHHRRRAATTATRCSASRPGWTRRWASPSTGTAACRTSSSPRRSRATATWNSAHFKNKEYDKLVGELHRGARPPEPAGGGQEDPGAAARRDADHLRLLLLLPVGDQVQRWPGVDVSAMGHCRRHARPARRPDPGGSRCERRTADHRPLPGQASRPRARHAVPAQHRDLSGLPGAARQRRPAHPGPVRRSGSVDALNKRARHRSAADRPVLGLDLQLRHGRHRRRPYSSRSPVRRGRHRSRSWHRRKLALLAFVIVVPLGDLRRRDRRHATRAAFRRPPDLGRRPVGHGDPGVRLGGVLHPRSSRSASGCSRPRRSSRTARASSRSSST